MSNFDSIYQQIMHNILFEQEEEGRVALLPGGFKPPHKGHFQALRHIIDSHNATSAVVFIGTGERDGITADQSRRIWEIYAGYIGIPVRIEVSDVTPVRSVYEYADEHKNRHLFVGAGAEDMKRYAWFEKHADEFDKVELVSIPPQFGRISGTEIRQKIINNDEDALDFVPDIIHWSIKDNIANILNIKPILGTDKDESTLGL